MHKNTASNKQRIDRRGANTIQIAPDLCDRLDKIKTAVGAAHKAHLARLALEWALSKLESGECVITNGKLVPATGQRQPAAA